MNEACPPRVDGVKSGLRCRSSPAFSSAAAARVRATKGHGAADKYL